MTGAGHRIDRDEATAIDHLVRDNERLRAELSTLRSPAPCIVRDDNGRLAVTWPYGRATTVVTPDAVEGWADTVNQLRDLLRRGIVEAYRAGIDCDPVTLANAEQWADLWIHRHAPGARIYASVHTGPPGPDNAVATTRSEPGQPVTFTIPAPGDPS